MAMRRLSIVDLEGGWQPLYNEDKSLALMCNGEIYNSVELRASLELRGHRYRTHSDCESILHLYEEHGLDFVRHLRGMFALALWDSHKRRLVLARDPMGEKPLYLYSQSGRLLFASEMKAILATGTVPIDLDPEAVHSYMHYGWIPDPATAITGVRKLRAGHLLVIDVDTWKIQERRYWNLQDASPIEGDPTMTIRAELEHIATMVTRSDVPVGVALSGGLDSSLVAALAAKRGLSLQAFCAGYEGRPAQDERSVARSFATRLGLPFHEAEISTDQMANDFPKLCLLRDDPVADIAGYGYLAVAELARDRGCPVLLQGHGGDELFWGYQWSVRAVRQSALKLAGHRLSPIRALLAELPRGLGRSQLIRAAQLSSGLAAGWRRLAPGNSSPDQRLVFYDLVDGYQIATHGLGRAYTAEFLDRVGAFDPGLFFQRTSNERTDIQVLDRLCAGYLRENGLTQADRLSMASSVEVRLPLVDHRLAELVVGLQKAAPSYDLRPKQWLRDAARDLLPADIRERPKRGFNPPVNMWLNTLRRQYGKELPHGHLVEMRVLKEEAAIKLIRPAGKLSYVANDFFLKFLTLEFWLRAMSGLATRTVASELGTQPINRPEAKSQSPLETVLS